MQADMKLPDDRNLTIKVSTSKDSTVDVAVITKEDPRLGWPTPTPITLLTLVMTPEQATILAEMLDVEAGVARLKESE